MPCASVRRSAPMDRRSDLRRCRADRRRAKLKPCLSFPRNVPARYTLQDPECVVGDTWRPTKLQVRGLKMRRSLTKRATRRRTSAPSPPPRILSRAVRASQGCPFPPPLLLVLASSPPPEHISRRTFSTGRLQPTCPPVLPRPRHVRHQSPFCPALMPSEGAQRPRGAPATVREPGQGVRGSGSRAPERLARGSGGRVAPHAKAGPARPGAGGVQGLAPGTSGPQPGNRQEL